MKANFLLVQPWLVVLLYRNDPICGLTLYWNTILVRSHTKYCVTSRIMIEKASNQRETDKLSLQNGWIFAFILMSQQSKKHLTNSKTMDPTTVYGHPERAFFQKFENFGLGQTNWAEVLWGILGISDQIISTILALWVPCPSESVAVSISYKKLWFLCPKHTIPKSSQNKKWAVKNSGNSVHTSVFGDYIHHNYFFLKCAEVHFLLNL